VAGPGVVARASAGAGGGTIVDRQRAPGRAGRDTRAGSDQRERRKSFESDRLLDPGPKVCLELKKDGRPKLIPGVSLSSVTRKEVAMGRYVLPDLEYDFGALEPHISGQIMELHHGKHHKTYVEKANETLEQMDEARRRNDFSRVAGLEKALAFNLSGHVLHSIFWKNMTPKGGDRPTGELASAIERDFGSFEAFQAQLTEVAATIMGSGWGALVYEPIAQRLLTCQIYDHQSNLSQGGVALLVIDAWEHAYYLQYKNQKTAFFKAVWNLWKWNDVEARYQAARKLNLAVPHTAEGVKAA
jgi:superoxide dismutase, Fe-Mn family